MTDEEMQFSRECVTKFILAKKLNVDARDGSITHEDYRRLIDIWSRDYAGYKQLWAQVEQEMQDG